ncbi:hypothetical protein [Bdellovibrio sp. NC01]|uniref:hypothetical protein n=1 Tax=Bdellovibrio sp. NC01 TaxID=2220073 RepID=UPI001158166D|nr:hypothetical protein [Bdellovibrio sp. NC01]QDK38424.1 hypothetical protein DOE51_12980 [Bdellovibrio sp. NC01]
MRIKNLLYVSIVAVMLWAPISSRAMSLNDLTILIPLPNQQEFPLLLNYQDEGAQGPLLSKKTLLEFVQLVPEIPNSQLLKNAVRVIGVRIDPCFIEGEGPRNCRRQIRLVWQPVIFAEEGVTTRDAAVHSFYEFDDTTFTQIWKEWQALSSGQTSDALQIHPRMKAEGLKGPYYTKLRNLILKYCGEKTLIRMTNMNVMAGEQLWIFSGFDVVNGEPKFMTIPRIKGRTQGIISSSSAFQSFTGGMMPTPQEDPLFGKLIQDSYTVKKKSSDGELQDLMALVQEYENPDRHNPGTVDCASCHLANMAHQWGQANFKQWDWKNQFKNVAFTSTWNLNNTSAGVIRTNQMRALGYFMNQPAISQRVVNETASTAMYFKLAN